MASTPDSLAERAVARCIVRAVNGDTVRLALPGTDYELHLRLAAPLTVAAGQRVTGTIEAKALRIHPARAGGQFIEPIAGEPRIVAGTVLLSDPERRRVLIDCAVPMWLDAGEGQDFSVIEEGGLVNCHVQSGVEFREVGAG